MILVDTSVWVDHLRRPDRALADLLDRGEVLMHPFVTCEIACGSLDHRQPTLELMRDLPAAALVDADEVLAFIERRALHGHGIGYVDVHLLASTVLSTGARLWTRDKRLRGAAQQLGLEHTGGSTH